MKIALIVTNKFEDYHLLELKLDELHVNEIISGTTNGYGMLEEYIKTRPHVKVTLAKTGHQPVMRAYNAINEADNVIIFANGDGNRTEKAIANAINEKKNLKIYSYKSKAFDIKQEGAYVKIFLSGNLQRATNVEGIFLNQSELKDLLNRLDKVCTGQKLFGNEKTVDSLNIEEYIKWATGEKLIDDKILALPPIQRGFVWKPSQIQDLWDSLLRGMPTGAVMLQEFTSEQQGRDVRSGLTEVKDTNSSGFFLVDGQQRTLSMILGICGSETHKLWVDFSEKGFGSSKYRFRVTTKNQPFGYRPDGNKLSLDDRRKARDYWEDKISKAESKNINTITAEDFFTKAKPYKTSDKDGLYMLEVKELWKLKDESSLTIEDQTIKTKVAEFFNDLKQLKSQWIPLIKVPKFESDKSLSDDKIDPLTLLFERISTGGTKLTPEDLLFSMIKQEWPEAHNLVNNLQGTVGSLMKPTDFVMSAFRLSALLYNQEQKDVSEIADTPQPKGPYFHRHLKTLLVNDENYGLKSFIKEGSILMKAFKELIDTIEYKEDNVIGIPKMMFPFLDLYLLQTLLYYTIKKSCEIASERDDILRFIMFWMVNHADSKISSDQSKKAIEVIDGKMGLKDIYIKLSNKDEVNYPFLKIIKPEPKTQVKACDLVNLGERAKKYFGDNDHELYIKFSKNIKLLLWLQREYVSKTCAHYNPLAIDNEDNVPYDYDHLVPQSNWSDLRGMNPFGLVDNHPFYTLWIRRALGDSIGNYRILDSSDNRSRGDTPLEVLFSVAGFKKEEFEQNYLVNLEENDLEPWKKASPKENQWTWDNNRIQTFQYVVEKRVLELYNNMFKDLNFTKWNQ